MYKVRFMLNTCKEDVWFKTKEKAIEEMNKRKQSYKCVVKKD